MVRRILDDHSMEVNSYVLYSAWGDDAVNSFGAQSGFDGEEEGFDTFLAMSAPPPGTVSIRAPRSLLVIT